MRWARETAFDDIVARASALRDVPVPLIKGLIGHESQFDPSAVGDDGSSLGLMQVQLPTAREVGFNVTTAKLLDPETNIMAGTAYLAKQYVRVGGDWSAALSAYNGGYRPELGFGAPPFRNQAYVDSVLTNARYFGFGSFGYGAGAPTVEPEPADYAGPLTSEAKVVAGIVAAALAIFAVIAYAVLHR